MNTNSFLSNEYIFMDLNGNPLAYNPQEQIKLANQSFGTIDYRAMHPSTHTGIVELWGGRDRQEDRIIVREVADFYQLTEPERKKVIIDTIKILQTHITEKNVHGGSTLCLTILNQNKIYTASVGDSNAFLAVIDSNGKVNPFFRLNRILHHPNEPSEIKRIPSEYIRYQRLNGMLALSRAMGDNSFERFGLLHEPSEIYVDEINIPKNGKALVINACDGLTEDDCLKENDIIKLIEDNKEEAFDSLAVKLAKAAYDNGSGDNISVLITALEPESIKTKYLMIFDGHSGDAVSEFLYQEFDQVFNTEIKSYLKGQ